MSDSDVPDDPPVLNYVSPARVPESHPGSWSAGASLVCGLVPLAGLAFRSGPVFLMGVTVIPMFGTLLGALACFSSRRNPPDLGVALVALVINAAFAGFGLWVFFVRGLC